MSLRGGLLSRLGYLSVGCGDNGVPEGLAPSKASPNDDSGVTSVDSVMLLVQVIQQTNTIRTRITKRKPTTHSLGQQKVLAATLDHRAPGVIHAK